ncbi:MAG: hypothetical protein P8X55_18850 [Desulfosarcinaceae bacterium]
MELPRSIKAYIIEWYARHHTLGYLILDFEGRVVSWDGPLPEMGFVDLKAGQMAAEQLSCLVGVLPLSQKSLCLPLMKTKTDRTVDLHIFKIETGFGILLVDKTEREHRLAELLQKANEQALLRERPKNEH